MKAFLITPFSAERAGHEAPEDFAAVQHKMAEAAARAGVELGSGTFESQSEALCKRIAAIS